MSYIEKIYQRGHDIEALARPLAEEYIGEELYPVICSKGELSASCDGLTIDESIAWECKQYNQADYEITVSGELPEKHWPQCQQVLYVTEAEKLLFTISDGTEEKTAHIWVYPDQEQQQQILDGWSQFKKDLEIFSDEPELVEAQAIPVMSLPALAVSVNGEINIRSNLDIFGQHLKQFIEETNIEPKDDQDFANLDQACKVLKEAEDALKQAEKNALAQTVSIDEMRRMIDYLSETARIYRLRFEKLVKTEKSNRKKQIIDRAIKDYESYCNEITNDMDVKPVFALPKFKDSVKNKKNLSSIQDAVDTELANAKIYADKTAKQAMDKLLWFKKAAKHNEFLFNDLSTIIEKPIDDFKRLIKSRIDDYKNTVSKEIEQKEPSKITGYEKTTPKELTKSSESIHEETIIITQKEYEQLVYDSNLLKRLIDNGVKKWSGWDKSIYLQQDLYA